MSHKILGDEPYDVPLPTDPDELSKAVAAALPSLIAQRGVVFVTRMVALHEAASMAEKRGYHRLADEIRAQALEYPK